MIVFDTEISDVKILEPAVYEDERGYFFEAFNESAFQVNLGFKPGFCQINESSSVKATLRGLHAQTGNHAQAKLVRVVSGEVLDVAVDCRVDSLTFGSHVALKLSSENKRQLWIPEGFAHGFQVLSDCCILNYCVTSRYNPERELTIDCFDDELNIGWLDVGDALLSDKDRRGISFSDYVKTQRPQ